MGSLALISEKQEPGVRREGKKKRKNKDETCPYERFLDNTKMFLTFLHLFYNTTLWTGREFPNDEERYPSHDGDLSVSRRAVMTVGIYQHIDYFSCFWSAGPLATVFGD